jgi:hypothetical protein
METEVKNLFWKIQPEVFLISQQNTVLNVIKAMGGEEIYYMQSTQPVQIKYFVLLLNKTELNKKEIENTEDEFEKKIMQTLNLRKLNFFEFEYEYGIFNPEFIFQKPSPKGGGLINSFYKAGDMLYTLKQRFLLYATADMDYKTYLLKFNITKNVFKEYNITVDYAKKEEYVKRGVRVWNYKILIYKVIDIQITSLIQQVQQETQQEQKQEIEDIRVKKLFEKLSQN